MGGIACETIKKICSRQFCFLILTRWDKYDVKTRLPLMILLVNSFIADVGVSC